MTINEPKLYMAPMKGFTDHLFRSRFTEYFKGFDLAIAPFISTKRDNKFKKKYIKDLLPENNTRLPVIPQILSNSKKDFEALAGYLNDFGYETVNWNLGCPYPMVANKKRGSGMLPHTEMIHSFLDYVIPRMKGKLSIKTRLGWQQNADLFKLIPVLNQYPIKELIIHPRTGIQRYDGTVDLDAFEQCLSATSHVVVYNGDIKTPEDFKKLSGRFRHLKRWMIGRGSLSNPYLPLAIKSGHNNFPDKIQKIQQFHEALFEGYSGLLHGPSHVLNKMKGFWKYFSLTFKDCEKTLKKIKKSRKPDQYLDRVNHFFNTEAQLK